MLKAVSTRWPLLIPLIGLIYILIVREPYPVYFSAALILISLGLLLAFFEYRRFFEFLFLVIPVSLEIPLGLGDSKLFFPSEIILIILAVTCLTRSLFFNDFANRFISQPLTMLVFGYVFIMILTSFTSTMPGVSFKFTAINLLYIIVYFFMAEIYRYKYDKPGYLLYYLYGLGMLIVIVYALYYLNQQQFSKANVNMTVRPFYSDHAIYSACLAMLLPAFAAFSFWRKDLDLPKWTGIISISILILMVAGIIFSYSRAAWISLAVAGFFLICLMLKIRPQYLMLVILAAALAGYFKRNSIIDSWKLNKYSSTVQNATIEEETKSITNINSDVSNAERLNRWSCAYRMFLDKPWIGYGPGTYQFQYLKYQRPSEMTRISVMSAYNNPLGKGGSAHSEYLLALAESGIFGFIGIWGIILSTVFYGMKAYYTSGDKRKKIIAAVALLSVITYASHVLFNNYLNIDKTASLFWLGVSIIASISIINTKPAVNESGT